MSMSTCVAWYNSMQTAHMLTAFGKEDAKGKGGGGVKLYRDASGGGGD